VLKSIFKAMKVS